MECPGVKDEGNPPAARHWHELGDIPGVCHDCAMSFVQTADGNLVGHLAFLRKADGSSAIHRSNSSTDKTWCGLFAISDLIEAKPDPGKPYELCLKCKQLVADQEVKDLWIPHSA